RLMCIKVSFLFFIIQEKLIYIIGLKEYFMNEDFVVDIADRLLEKSATYGEAIKICQQVEHEIKLRAYEQKIEEHRYENS
ncbi:hypothetical protein, partial [Streptococcus suis]